MGKLNQVIAVVNGRKTKVQKELSSLHHRAKKPELYYGMSRTYTPLDEDGETMPPETKRVQYTAGDALDALEDVLTDLIDVVATQDYNNTKAFADVVVDGETVLSQVPVTTLLFLEKQLNEISTYVEKIPVLDPSEEWKYDSNRGVHVTNPTTVNRTKKKPTPIVLAEATDKHPAQVDTFTEDVLVGRYHTRKMSGAMPADTKKALLDNVEKLRDAVKMAREEANNMEVENVKYGKKLFNFLFS